MKPEEIQKLAQTVKHLILDDIAVDVPPQRSDDDIYNALGEKFTDRTLRQMPKIVGISNIVDANDYQDTKGLNGFLTATMVNGVRRFIVTSANFSTFIGLTDTPSTYLGNSLKSIRIKADETGVEFVPAVDSDEKVKVSATDTSAEYLGATITTSGIAVKTITSPGTNEKLNIDVTIPAYTGDVTSSAGATVTAISSNAVTNSKLAQVPSLTFKGNATGATANVADLTVAQVKALLGIVTPASQLLYNQTNNLSVTNTTSPTALQNTWFATSRRPNTSTAAAGRRCCRTTMSSRCFTSAATACTTC